MRGDVLEHVLDRAHAEAVPLEVLFEVTHRCNLPCEHCYLADKHDHGELSLEEIEALFADLAAAGTLVLTLTGGEPFSRRDFLDIVDLAHDAGFALKILTNATRITDEIAAHFAARNVLEVSVSVYAADAETHDRVTALPGSYARTMAGIDRLRTAGVHVVVKTPLMTLNGAAARSVHELTRAHGVPCRFDTTITPRLDGDASTLELQLARPRLVQILKQEPFRSENAGVSFDGPGPSPCAAGRAFCSIGPTGDVQPCIMMPRVVGNVRDARFAQVWASSALFDRLRALEPGDLVCTTCDVKGACSRCPGLAMQRGADIDGCDESARTVATARVDARRQIERESIQLEGAIHE